jgi:hypothetical protein
MISRQFVFILFSIHTYLLHAVFQRVHHMDVPRMSTVKLEEDEAPLLFCATWYDNLNFEFSIIDSHSVSWKTCYLSCLTD